MPPVRYEQEPIAIVGLACRLPGSCNSPNALWDFLMRGEIAPRTPPGSRFEFSTHHDGSKKPHTMISPGGMFIDADPRDIDVSFFRLTKSEATAMDPQQRQLLEVVYEGLENAGVTLDAINGQPIGCFVGSYACDYADMQARNPEERANMTTLGTGRAMLSNRLSHFLNIKGPSMTIDTACSGSLFGLDVANRYLQTGEISGAIVAGSNIYLSPEHVMDNLSASGTSSLSGLCHTFDEKADGYIKAEAVNMVFLKRLDDAIRDGDPVRAILRGSATGSDGWTAGIASPNSAAQAATIRQAYANAGITNLAATNYIECHGTGTKAGDVIEVNGISSVFTEAIFDDTPLRIGSLKSNIGHSEPAAGISGLLKVVLALEHGVIPGNPTFVTPNSNIDFKRVKLWTSRTASRWEEPPSLRRASINSFGYGGANAHAVVDSAQGKSSHISSYPDDEDLFADEPTIDRPYVLSLSGNDTQALQDNIEALQRHIANPAVRISMRDLAYTLSEKRTHHFHRGYLVADGSDISQDQPTLGKSTSAPRIGLVFTGQGAQWPQMGRDLVANFPQAKAHILHLSSVLTGLPDSPKWSLIEELTLPRTREQYMNPELSQTLVTALQLALLAVLADCGLGYQTVVGHSSGEIAAAVAAGCLTPELAIKIAFYRGKATSSATYKSPVGMMAVGLSEKEARACLGTTANVQIACVNSPKSITLAGDRAELVELETRIKSQGHFARLLLVDAAYHSEYMADVASNYRSHLEHNCDWKVDSVAEANMYSTVTGSINPDVCNASYWEANMRSPVLFDYAVQRILQANDAPEMLIEIGPSNALSGPINQIKQHLNSNIPYMPAWKRGPDALRAFCDLAGQLFIRGNAINLARFNQDFNESPLAVIVDLPNYRWNHSVKYWHEGNSSKEWRYRKYPHHDILGTKILGTPWQHPIWSKLLRVQDLAWIPDHKLGESIVFPGAGYIAMAIEAAFQTEKATQRIPKDVRINQMTYILRDTRFLRAMLLEDGTETRVITTLTSRSTSAKQIWYDFKISTQMVDLVTDHCQGLIQVQEAIAAKAGEKDMLPLEFPEPGSVWYKTMRNIGYSFGPSFQRQLQVESVAGSHRSRSLLSFEASQSSSKESAYALHPTSIDVCFQSVAASIWKGSRSSVDIRLVPSSISELIIAAQSTPLTLAMSIATSRFAGVGRVDDPKTYASDVSAYDHATHQELVRLTGLKYRSLEMDKTASDNHVYNRSIWRPDVTKLTETQWRQLLECEEKTAGTKTTSTAALNEVLDLMAFKKPDMRVLEVNFDGVQPCSVWIDGCNTESFDRTTCCYTTLVVPSHSALSEVTRTYGHLKNLTMQRAPDVAKVENPEPFDVVIVKVPTLAVVEPQWIVKARQFLLESGYLVVVEDTNQSARPHPTQTEATQSFIESLQEARFDNAIHLPYASCYLGSSRPQACTLKADTNKIGILHFNSSENETAEISCALSSRGWDITHYHLPLAGIEPGSTVMVLDELWSPVLTNVSQQAWSALKTVLSSKCRVLWTTLRSVMDVAHPDRSLIYGLARSICSEDPTAMIMTLDVASPRGDATVGAISQAIQAVQTATTTTGTDCEFIERGGMVYIGRIIPDAPLNRQQRANAAGAESLPLQLFQQQHRVRLQSYRPGALDSLVYAEVPDDDAIPATQIDVEIHAVSLNFKDIAISMGYIPGNEYLLGLDGAGVIRQAPPNCTQYRVGQRVLASTKGSLANRVRCDIDGEVFPIPDGVSFEVASTLNTVYSTAFYALVDVAHVKAEMSVLIHSAAGGLGLAAVQICKHLGATIFATVGADAKRKHLVEKYAIPDEHIFSSRSADFAVRLKDVTAGKGVDVVLNSLTGELLHASWGCIATAGTFIELGKRDILDGECLSMAPFNRNARFCGVDMSHDSITPALLKDVFGLLKEGHIQPEISKVYGFADAQAAFRHLGTGESIGKIVISRTHDQQGPIVPIRAAAPRLSLRLDASYLIVGGLKGLCGSLAVYLAQEGTKTLVILSRSGYDDEKSRSIISKITSLGCRVDLVKGDVTSEADVERAFTEASAPIFGVVQGAMVLRDKLYSSMTHTEFHAAIAPKVQGTWNLHRVALRLGNTLDFFTLLSSLCGIVGQKGQSNYAAANAFLDSFAHHRRALNLAACAVDLGLIEDVGYVDGKAALDKRLRSQGWHAINETLLAQILYFSILQQKRPALNPSSSSHLIAGMPVPLPEQSPAQRDPRFSALRHASGLGAQRGSSSGGEAQSAVQILREAWKAQDGDGDQPELLSTLIVLANKQFMKSLGMAEEMDPVRPIASYGIDSLVAVEFKNWTSVDLGVEVATLDIMGAKTLASLCQVILKRGFQSRGQK
ncbi:putative polyketide synthase [Mytilinidion resinicola]|uniref:Polyketide synthase n=1 Tax=Mytilinidion resinicola TaxID=574789 RepID=A0A6A6YBI1_9PEZI|nr:putative polyketide synthase [Mytilinidion resinicola]KAF2805465.1 putative polyketide synthase [Mytilinidion resinicola]